ncbi:zinc finger protein 260-like isoform X5 [Ostrinia furnacalis]|uniref:zinc finger protein 260-like isoform X5 n=1 Tax=Ostrinia furnacalis TaxID=93504 RepID=UPI00103EE10F|nr:zinc finger protein 260-like isoform X5 [Ostrinia furnacalis]
MSGESWKLEQNLCRCCHSEGAHKNLSEACIDGEDEILSDMLHDTLDITINPVTGPLGLVTYTICEPCMMRLQDAWSFKQQVVDCERRFHELYSRNALKMDPDNVIVVDVKQEVDVPIVVKTSPNEGVKEERLHSDDDDFLPVDDVQSDISDQEQTKKKRKPRGRPKAPPKIKRTPRHAQNKTQKVDDSTADDGKEKKDASKDPVKNGFACEHCPRVYKQRSHLKSHIENIHNNVASTCQHCNKKFESVFKMKKHIYIHKLFDCPECSQKFHKMELVYHRADEHGVPMPTCGVCGYRHYNKFIVVSHQRRVHMNEKTVPCPECGEKFFSIYEMRDHQVRHNPVKKFECKFCKKMFPRMHTLIRHERIHTGDKRKVCTVCGEKFVQKASLSYHMMKRHPDQV